jgi:2-dehydro-3-deoxygluconokinase
MQMTVKIACIGEAMVELVLGKVAKTAELGFAGDTLNTAIYLRRALPAAEVAFVSVIGCDGLSDRMLAMIASEGVSTRLLARHPDRLPGIYSISTDAAGERSFSYWRDRSAARTLFQPESGVAFDALDSFDVVYLSAISLAILPPEIRVALFDWIDGFRQRGGRFAFDSNYRPRLWATRDEARLAVEQAWRRCDIALPSADDEMALFGDPDTTAVRHRLRGWGVLRGALKCSAAGPLSLGPSVVCTFGAADRVVDTTAAGDSFNAGYLAAHLSGATEAEALQRGHAFARLVIGHPGAIVPKAAWKDGL